QIVERAQESRIAFVNLEFVDVLGVPECVTIGIDQLEHCVSHGQWIDGSSLEGFARVAETDLYLLPDVTTYAELPWVLIDREGCGASSRSDAGGFARLICDVVYPDASPFEGSPRYVLQRVTQAAAMMGYTFEVSPELEFFLFDAPPDRLSLPPMTS